ncbi:MAG: radical SAM family heme chaperone HemW [Bacteroidales bacterium]
MAGIYIHIPYCHQKCHYCNFYSTASKKTKPLFVSALLKEIKLQKEYLHDEIISTIYFGGGTPSQLNISELKQIIQELFQHYNISDKVEITLEANPDDLTEEKLFELSKAAFNRLSIGIQSFKETDLQYLNRSHSANQAIHAIKTAQKHQFSNLSIDLIYGIPTLSNESWIENIQTAMDLNIPHISAYCLTVETGTALDIFIRKGKMPAIDEEKASQQFEILMDILSKNNYIHYEISNFCKQGYVSQHNSNYWKQQKYLGLGPSAHSYNFDSRQWNISNISNYIDSIEKMLLPFEGETLSLIQQYDEYILTSLRAIWGIDEFEILNKYGEKYYDYFKQQIETYIQKAWVERNGNIYTLTKQGKYFADGIASELFITTD